MKNVKLGKYAIHECVFLIALSPQVKETKLNVNFTRVSQVENIQGKRFFLLGRDFCRIFKENEFIIMKKERKSIESFFVFHLTAFGL